LETARQVASISTSSTPLPYDQMKNQCEALETGKQQKMLTIRSFKNQQETKAIVLSSENEEVSRQPVMVSIFLQQFAFILHVLCHVLCY
jgi:protein EFR3